MYWADKIADDILKSGTHTPYWVDDMKTPSGRVHIGSLRGVVVHDLVYKALKSKGTDVTFTYVLEDQDPMDDVPSYLDFEEWKQYLGKPLFSIPSPDGKAKNYATYFAQEFEEVFNKIGCHPKIIWTMDLYRSGRMNADIKLSLDKAEEIKKIFETTYKKTLPERWYPFQVLCPECGKQSTTIASDWDGQELTFTCKVDAVKWTNGCGYSGKISPFSDAKRYAGKLPWKVEWPVKWKVIGVTVEGAGKDHMSRGGSHDVAKQICEQVIKYPVPYPVPYEFFLIGGRKMSSSKGRGTSAKEVSEILPPYLLRFLMTRAKIEQTIDFDPMGMTIPDLFDEYDRCWQAYMEDEASDYPRIFELSQIGEIPAKEKIFIPRFRDVANFFQLPNVDLIEKFAELKGSKLTTKEKEILKERLTYAKIWVDNYASEEYRYQISERRFEELALNPDQWNFLNQLAEIWKVTDDPEKLQAEIFTLIKKTGIEPKSAFNALYTVLLDKSHGPRAGWLLKKFPKEVVIARFTLNKNRVEKNQKELFTIINDSSVFSIDAEVKKRFPTITVGLAIIKDVKITKTNSDLQKEINTFLKTQENLTTEELGKYPEIQSYRKIYKETSVDWHSRRPSPEALLRRIALKKGLYSINTCVDAYNLVVMRNRVSSGAFNLDEIKFPTVLRFAKQGETIHLLGDDQPTEYKAGEIAYFDQVGGFNMDFNYRDGQRTKVDENTKNIWINIEGVYDITRNQVEKTLEETIQIITKYCGGIVELAGIVSV